MKYFVLITLNIDYFINFGQIFLNAGLFVMDSINLRYLLTKIGVYSFTLNSYLFREDTNY